MSHREVSQLADEIIRKIDEAQQSYHRLVLVVGPAGSGKTRLLQEIARARSAPLINVNLELSRRLLDLSGRQRALQVHRLLTEITDATTSDLILLDNMELLFDVDLKQDPMRLLKALSRNKTIVAAWNGRIEGNIITYAAPDHPEYRRYSITDCLIVNCEQGEK